MVCFFRFKASFNDLLKYFYVENVASTSLTLIRNEVDVEPSKTITIQPMQLKAFKVRLK